MSHPFNPNRSNTPYRPNNNRSNNAYRGPRKPENEHRLNDEITASRVRLVSMPDEAENGVYTLREALDMAEKLELDLVEISDKSDPPVCRIISYSKFKYEQKKREREMKSKNKVLDVKDIRFGPNTDDSDFDFKLEHAKNFLIKGHKVRAYVHFSGRQIVYKARGEELLKRFIEGLDDHGKVEMEPRLEGKRIYIMLAPKSKK